MMRAWPSWGRRLWQARRALAVYAVLILLGWTLSTALRDLKLPEGLQLSDAALRGLLIAAFVVYVLASAIPFVPGAEIGFVLLMLFGTAAVPWVYAGMVLALLLSFAAAARLPLGRLAEGLSGLGLRRAADFVARLAAADRAERMAMLAGSAPQALGPRLVAHRYLVLVLVLNTPGNSLLGGGGGLAFLAGASGVFTPGRYLAAVLVAVAPIPLAFFLAGP